MTRERRYANAEHAKRRAALEAEREERRRQEEELRRGRLQKKKSSSIKAKWYKDKGIVVSRVKFSEPGQEEVTIGKLKISKGMFYAGSNMVDMVEPRLQEPSILDPTYEIIVSSGEVPPLPRFPYYQGISSEQRGKYVSFLASDRTETDDIGCVFLYLFGFERRLLIDARKPDEVSNEERLAIAEELLRLYECFKEQSRSFCHYVTGLMLFDGTIFKSKKMDEERIRSVFLNDTFSKRFEVTENTDAYEYLLLARLAEQEIQFPLDDLLQYPKGRLFRNKKMSFLDFTLGDLTSGNKSRAFKELYKTRFIHSSLNVASGYPVPGDSPIHAGGRPTPLYYPASLLIRKYQDVSVSSAKCIELDALEVPFSKISDMAIAAYDDIWQCNELLKNKSFRGVENVPSDAFHGTYPMEELQEFLKGKSGVTSIPISLFRKEFSALLDSDVATTARDLVSAYTQNAIEKTLEGLGWQAVVPTSMPEKSIANYWRLNGDSSIVAFKRGIEYDSVSGIQKCAAVFGPKDVKTGIHVPEAWNSVLRLVYIYAWFIKASGEEFNKETLKAFPRRLYPRITKNSSINQTSVLFCCIMATCIYNLSNQGIKDCLVDAKFSDVQAALFSWCNEKFGTTIPKQAIEALEKVYEKSGIDKSMVLYDYHAGNYRMSYDEDDNEEFSIDAEKLAETISFTSDVHSILNEAFGTDDYDDAEDEEEQKICPESQESENKGKEPEDKLSLKDIEEKIKSVFGDSDEIERETLFSFIKTEFKLETSSDVLGFIAETNKRSIVSNGEELIEIDGEFAYLNL